MPLYGHGWKDNTGKNSEFRAHSYQRKTAAVILRELDDPEARDMALRLERSSSERLDLARALKIEARLDRLKVYTVDMKRAIRKGETNTYVYWYASWRLDGKVRNVYLGRAKIMSLEEALVKAVKLKGEYLKITSRMI
jgi:hypothetical protein